MTRAVSATSLAMCTRMPRTVPQCLSSELGPLLDDPAASPDNSPPVRVLSHDDEFCTGSIVQGRVGPGMWMISNAFRVHQPMPTVIPGAGLIKFHFQLEGELSLVLPGEEVREIRPGSWACMLHPRDVLKGEWCLPTLRHRSVTLYCSTDALLRFLGEHDQELPVSLGEFLRHPSERPIELSCFSGAAELLTIAGQLLSNPYKGAFRQLFAEMKYMELLLASLARLTGVATEASVVSRDRDRVYAAREIIRKELLDPPSLAALSARVGLNRRKLSESYRREFGLSVFEYVTSVRMDLAAELLLSTDERIEEISYRCGYSHGNSFSEAFRRHHGMTPGEFRSRRS